LTAKTRPIISQNSDDDDALLALRLRRNLSGLWMGYLLRLSARRCNPQTATATSILAVARGGAGVVGGDFHGGVDRR